MREIKFRQWCDGEIRMLGNTQVSTGQVGFSDTHYTDVSMDDREEYPLMQYTGLKDKNGVEIYEGDILAAKFNARYVDRIHWNGPPDAICEVKWDYSAFRLVAQGDKDRRYISFEDLLDEATFSSLLMMQNSESEVIGNIYENPELLNKS